MSGPSIDLEKPNAIGGLDRLVTNFAFSAIAVIPTFLTCIFMPWRVSLLLERDDPDGREGMLLAPGAYFPLSLMVSFVVGAVLATPETVISNGSFIGPDLALSVLTEASEGNIWKIVATIMPIYAVAVFIGLLGMILKPWAPQHWTLRVSLRSAFYITATLVSWMILTTAIVDLVRIWTGSNDIPSFIYSVVLFPTIAAIIWMYFWFFNAHEAPSRIRSAVLSVAMIGIIAAIMFLVDMIIRM